MARLTLVGSTPTGSSTLELVLGQLRGPPARLEDIARRYKGLRNNKIKIDRIEGIT